MVTPGTGIIGSAPQGVLPTRQREDRQRRQQDLTRLQDQAGAGQARPARLRSHGRPATHPAPVRLRLFAGRPSSRPATRA